MITEDYVSFETAKLLKEKGFDEHCFCINYPLPEGEHHSIILPNLLNNSMIPFTDEYKFCRYKEDFITIPTLQMAMKWLRETHDIDFDINTTGSRHVRRYHLAIWENKDEEMVTINPIGYFNKWEQACEAAIKYCLEHLL
jgi:hypothetical protein